jgi:hypothetical protein
MPAREKCQPGEPNSHLNGGPHDIGLQDPAPATDPGIEFNSLGSNRHINQREQVVLTVTMPMPGPPFFRTQRLAVVGVVLALAGFSIILIERRPDKIEYHHRPLARQRPNLHPGHVRHRRVASVSPRSLSPHRPPTHDNPPVASRPVPSTRLAAGVNASRPRPRAISRDHDVARSRRLRPCLPGTLGC